MPAAITQARHHVRHSRRMPVPCRDSASRHDPVTLGGGPSGKRRERLNTGSQQFTHQSPVEVHSLGIWLSGAFRENTRPGDRELVRVGADILHHRYVFGIAMIVVDGDVAGIAVLHVAGHVGIRVPDRLPLAVLGCGALDLMGGSRHASPEVAGKLGGPGSLPSSWATLEARCQAGTSRRRMRLPCR